ncbi:MAG: glycosyltransferase [Chlorobium sp.]|nr:glycosyltransferase [Chlorobium sp.]
MEVVAYTGAVVIGRNEGELLRQCLLSVVGKLDQVVYADSGSTDGSIELAHKMGATVVALDPSSPFTAARGRNEGFTRLMELAPDTKYVQFIDGDCEVMAGWLEAGVKFLQSHAQHAVVCGRLRERYPEASIYNRLCDIEWNGAVGDIDACGGIFMIRANTFTEIGVMNSTISAGEEPEMCLRLRRQGWLIARIDKEMGWHDANMTSFSQWWKRAMRSGHSYAQGYALHGKEKEKYCLRPSLRIWGWAFVLPLLIILVTIIWAPRYSSLFWGIYFLQFIKIALGIRRKIPETQHALLYSLFNLLGKFPEMIGQIQYLTSFDQRTKFKL